jgi:SAM-dependent methyltransferase
MDPQQRSIALEFDRYRDSYADAVDRSVRFSGLKADFFTRVKARSLLDLTRRRLGDPTDVRALDFGCGVGGYHALLGPAFGALTGVDVSAECVAEARARHPHVAYETYDGGALPFADGAFDLAFAITVFHHIAPAQWGASLAEMRRVLRPGGLAAIYEHNPLNPLTMHVVNTCPFDERAVLLRKREARALVEAHGFVEIEAKTILTAPPIGPLGRALDRAFASLPLGAQYYVAGRAP